MKFDSLLRNEIFVPKVIGTENELISTLLLGKTSPGMTTHDVVRQPSYCFLRLHQQFLEAEHSLYFLIISAACSQPNYSIAFTGKLVLAQTTFA